MELFKIKIRKQDRGDRSIGRDRRILIYTIDLDSIPSQTLDFEFIPISLKLRSYNLQRKD